jgi:peptide chain release factor 2
MKEFLENIEQLQTKLNDLKTRLHLQDKEERLLVLDKTMNEPDFWQDQNNAKKVSQEAADIRQELEQWQKLNQEVLELKDLGQTDNQDDSWQAELDGQFAKISSEVRSLETKTFFNGPYDDNGAIVTIFAGAGGDDAQDWAEMLFRMYLRYCEKRGWKTTVIDESRGGEAGIKSVTVEIEGRLAYGYLKTEAGVHRLVRMSPFDADHARHTSFSALEVVPIIEEEIVELKPADLQIDVFRSSGNGGQSVNTTDSAVRITHIPTGLKVTCQNERSQFQNKETAMKFLKGKLVQYQAEIALAKEKKIKGDFVSAAWGNQIRSYVLHPYKLVKDHRTGYEETDPEKVLNGELDNFIEEFLKQPKPLTES